MSAPVDDRESRRTELPSTGASSIDAEAETRVHSEAPLRGATEPDAIEPGDTLGRYEVERELGRGGMGRVFAARDPKLDRRVAIKVLRDRPSGTQTRQATRAQLLDEGKAMAKLSHPNVVPVYDVGLTAHGVFVAMELVEGRTLGAWVRDTQPPWPQILAALLEAGRGLAAIHAAGLVHRDFKPANVMIGSDGRVQVMDFGLALVDGAGGGATVGSSAADHSHRTAFVMGTPGYMSPEQITGQETDARSDQFSFCVAAHRLLYGVRPFAGSDNARLVEMIERGELVEVPAESQTPRWIRRILARGLAAAPEQRWESMEALLSALGRRRARRNAIVWSLAGLGVTAATVVALWNPSATSTPCRSGADRMAGVWDLSAKAPVRDAFARTGTELADDTWGRIEARLDAYAAALVDAYDGACTDAASADARALDRRVACLDERRQELDALVTVLADADADMVRRAVGAAVALRPIDACSDGTALAELPPAEIASDVEAIRTDLQRVVALQRAGRYTDAKPAAEAVVERARAVGYDPLTAEALERLGSVLESVGEYDASKQALEEGFWLASSQSLDRVAVMTSTELIYLLGFKLAQPEAAQEWKRHAEAAVDRIGRGGIEEAGLYADSAAAEMDLGRQRESYERALALYEDNLGPDHPNVALMHNNLASTLDELGDMDLARTHYERAIEIYEATEGMHHPDLGRPLSGLGAVHARQGRLEEADATFQRALAVLIGALGPDAPDVGAVLLNRANILSNLGRFDEAIESLLRAKQILERVHGPEHPLLSAVANNLGHTYSRRGDLDEALAQFEEAKRLLELTGPDQPRIAGAISNIAGTWLARGDATRALEEFRRAGAMWERLLGRDFLDLHYALTGEARALLALDRAAEAIAPARRSVDILVSHHGDPGAVVASRLVLIDALDRVPGHEADADEQVRLVREAIGTDPAYDAERTALDERAHD